MNIQKCKVDKNREWTLATKKTLAAVFGVSALVSLSACDLTSPDSTTSGAPTYTPDSSTSQPNSSASNIPDGGNSSSSFSIDTLEVTSGEIVPPLESSSSIVPPSSSSLEPPLSAGILPPEQVIPPEPEAGSPFDQGSISSSSQQRIESSSATSGLSSSFSDVVPPESSSSSDTTIIPEPLAGDPIIIDDPIDTVAVQIKTKEPENVQAELSLPSIREKDLLALSGCPSNMNDTVVVTKKLIDARLVPSEELELKDNE